MRGSNDSPATAQPVAGFGTGRGQNPRARLLGTLSPEEVGRRGGRAERRGRRVDPVGRRHRHRHRPRDGITTSADDRRRAARQRGQRVGRLRLLRWSTAVAGEALTVDIDTPIGELDSMVAAVRRRR